MKKEALEDHLGAVLERSWLVLGAVLGAFWGVLYWKTSGFVNNRVFEQRRRREATWSDLESVWVPKRLQNGSRGGSRKELS